jgi:hypothetical protein
LYVAKLIKKIKWSTAYLDYPVAIPSISKKASTDNFPNVENNFPNVSSTNQEAILNIREVPFRGFFVLLHRVSTRVN